MPALNKGKLLLSDINISSFVRNFRYFLNLFEIVYAYLCFSSECTVIPGVRQGSTDGPGIFNLFINDLAFFAQYCTLNRYADNNNLFLIDENKD